jgi:hypothetical protein
MLLPPAPIAYLRCTRPTLLPLPCRTWEIVGLWPRHPSHAFVRLDQCFRLQAWGWLPVDDLFALARHLVHDGTLAPLTARCNAQLYRPARARWPSGRPRG